MPRAARFPQREPLERASSENELEAAESRRCDHNIELGSDAPAQTSLRAPRMARRPTPAPQKRLPRTGVEEEMRRWREAGRGRAGRAC